MIWFSAIISGLALMAAFGIFFADSNGMLEGIDPETITEARDFSESLMLVLIAPLCFYIYRF